MKKTKFFIFANKIKEHLKAESIELSDYEIGHLAVMMDKELSQSLSDYKKELVEEVKKMSYKNKHHHDFQLPGSREGFPDDNKYYCLNCRLPVTDFNFPKDKYLEKFCPHFSSYNKALKEVLSLLQKDKEN